jgi:hypothetical protein
MKEDVNHFMKLGFIFQEKAKKICRNLRRRCIIDPAGGMDGENGCGDLDPGRTRKRKKV